MSGIQQNFAYGRSFGFPNGWPVAKIGDAYGGGFFAGQINDSGTIYNLVVAPRASGQANKRWGVYGTTTGVISPTDGKANTTSLVALGSAYEAAIFCNNLNAGAGLNGYTDWYLPARYEIEVLYFFLKGTVDFNAIGQGANPNAVSPEPINTNYQLYVPAQTTATEFQTGGTEYFDIGAGGWWSSTEKASASAYYKDFFRGYDSNGSKNSLGYFCRAIRRVPV